MAKAGCQLTTFLLLFSLPAFTVPSKMPSSLPLPSCFHPPCKDTGVCLCCGCDALTRLLTAGVPWCSSCSCLLHPQFSPRAFYTLGLRKCFLCGRGSSRHPKFQHSTLSQHDHALSLPRYSCPGPTPMGLLLPWGRKLRGLSPLSNKGTPHQRIYMARVQCDSPPTAQPS